MTDKPLSDILTFGTPTTPSASTPSDLNQQSHLSTTNLPRIRSDPNMNSNKRIKPSEIDQNHSLKQLDLAKQVVHQVIADILDGAPLKLGYGFYYQKVESICKFKHSEQSKLADYLKEKIDVSFEQTVKLQVQELLDTDSLTLDQFISKYLSIYTDWEHKLRLLSKIFLYIDRGYLLPHPNKKMVLELGLNLFTVNLLSGSAGDVTMAKYLEFLETNLRYENESDFEMLSNFSQMLVKLNFNNLIKLNSNLVEQVAKIFESLRMEWLNVPQTYIHISLTKISKVITFFKDCGQPKEFIAQMLMRLKWVMIFQDFNEVIGKCLPYILNSDNSKQILMIYKFCGSTMNEYSFDSMSILVYQWGKIILHEVGDKVSERISERSEKTSDRSGNLDKSTEKTNIIIMLNDLNNHYRLIVKEKFQNNEKFELEIRNSFSKALNSDKKFNNYIMIQLCKYVDGYLKNYGSKTAKKHQSLGDFKDNFLTIFKYLNNKNDFLLIYKRELSRRLLLNKSASNNTDIDISLADSIIEIVGETDTSIGLKAMFKDLLQSRLKYSNVDFIPDLEFSGLVLEKKHWPEIPKSNEVKLPEKFLKVLEKFTEYYKKSEDKLANHDLNFDNYSLHQLTILATFSSGEYELNVNMYQAIVLDLFNSQSTWKINDILEVTQMDPKFLTRIIHSLSDKYRLLVDKDQEISLNNEFNEKSKRLKIPMLREKETSVVEEKIISRNRNGEIRSCLVKIMKVKTKLSFSDLLNKTVVELNSRGPVSINDIKVNIEYLIGNEYLSREGDSLVYVP